MPAGATAEVSAVTVGPCRDVVPVFSDTLTGIRGRQGDEEVCEGRAKSKSYGRCRGARGGGGAGGPHAAKIFSSLSVYV